MEKCRFCYGRHASFRDILSEARVMRITEIKDPDDEEWELEAISFASE
jgi:hypothetical protein